MKKEILLSFLSEKVVRKLGLICPDSKKIIFNQKGYVGPTRGAVETK
jgi:hypothetical protein